MVWIFNETTGEVKNVALDSQEMLNAKNCYLTEADARNQLRMQRDKSDSSDAIIQSLQRIRENFNK